MHPYYAELVADIKDKAPVDLENRLDHLEEDPDKISVNGHAMTEAASDDWDGEALGNSCSGSDTIVTYTAKNLVRDNLIPEVKYMLSSLMFPLFYIGLVFLCVALTVLSVQQLSDSVKYKFRYRVLSQIGYSRREIRRMISSSLSVIISVRRVWRLQSVDWSVYIPVASLIFIRGFRRHRQLIF